DDGWKLRLTCSNYARSLIYVVSIGYSISYNLSVKALLCLKFYRTESVSKHIVISLAYLTTSKNPGIDINFL
ncbi:MAG: hypothetical protein L0H53_08815, partial [Candidatus Nitrosocosmicus sp.]|nr:hypothetical protein [Candidatus Nitrosocosmicus sp.]